MKEYGECTSALSLLFSQWGKKSIVCCHIFLQGFYVDGGEVFRMDQTGKG